MMYVQDSACIFGKDMFVDLIVIDTICRFLTVPWLPLDDTGLCVPLFQDNVKN